MTIVIVVLLVVICALLYSVAASATDLLVEARKCERWLGAIDKREAEENVQRAARIQEYLTAKGSGRELLKARLARRLAEREAQP